MKIWADKQHIKQKQKPAKKVVWNNEFIHQSAKVNFSRKVYNSER